ncbi:MAG: patatin-like phospholipase family protein [Solirubrobacteraceae bacterium]
MSGASDTGLVALVLGGGGARGAYEFGALSVLLPALADEDRPKIIVGTSIGALNTTFLASRAHLELSEVLQTGKEIWSKLAFTDVCSHLLWPPPLIKHLFQYLGEFLGVPGARLPALLDPKPLPGTIAKHVDFDALQANIKKQTEIVTAAVVATSALTRRSVVFHAGGPAIKRNDRRLIEYVPTKLGVEHVLASTALPLAFPSVKVEHPKSAAGYYWDGGLRLNTPLKPALELGAERIVVIGLSSLDPGPHPIASDDRPDAFAGLGQVLEGVLTDDLVQDVQTLRSVNRHAAGRKVVPYILIAPRKQGVIEDAAAEVLKQYGFPRGLFHGADVSLVAKLTGARADPRNATLISMLMFLPEYLSKLMEIGAADARQWIDDHPGSIWET